MKRLMIFGALALGASVPAIADTPGTHWIARSKVTTMLERRGYTVTKIEADDGRWEGVAVGKGGKYEFHVDPHTGRITKMERDRD